MNPVACFELNNFMIFGLSVASVKSLRLNPAGPYSEQQPTPLRRPPAPVNSAHFVSPTCKGGGQGGWCSPTRRASDSMHQPGRLFAILPPLSSEALFREMTPPEYC